MATRKKTVLPDYSEDFDMLLFGICSGLKDYRLCFELNQKLEIDFTRIDDYKIMLGRNNSFAAYPRFSYVNDEEQTFIFLRNRSNEHHILPELKNIDFLLIIKPVADMKQNSIMHLLQEIGSVQSVFAIDVLKLKSRFNLLM